MPTPVYVWDAQERPLLPTSPAYARVLLRADKARHVSHPTLSIIQLTQPIPQPSAQPVLLAALLHGAYAELLLLTERDGRPVVLQRFRCDLELSSALSTDSVDHAAILHGIWRGLGHLLPISHMAVHQGSQRAAVYADEGSAHDVAGLTDTLPLLSTRLTRPPRLIAVWTAAASTSAAELTGQVSTSHDVTARARVAIGAVATMGANASRITGLITSLNRDYCEVQVPRVDTRNELVWQAHMLTLHALRHVWRRSEVAILRVTEVHRG